MFAAGQPRTHTDETLNEPVPIYVRNDPAKAANVVFVPDDDYAGNFQQFVADVEPLIRKGYFADSLFGTSRSRWNFYVTYNTGRASGYVTPPRVPSCEIKYPSNWATLAATADVAAIVHTRTIGSDGNVFRNCAPGFSTASAGSFMITSASPHVSTVVHETGHALFGLSDEYCCDGGVIKTTWPHQNLFPTDPACKSSASAHGVAQTNCVKLTTSSPADRACGGKDSSGNLVIGPTNNQFVQDSAGDLMGCYKGSAAAATPGTLDTARISWWFDQR
jgi:hypothetical protein